MLNHKINSAILAAVIGVLLLTASARAATYTVDTTVDNGALTACTAAAVNDCSLRSAILTANGTTADDTIVFDATVFASAQTITLTGGANGELQITGGSGTLTITGTGANLLTVSGNNQSTIFFALDGATVTISNLTITGGRGKNFGGSLGTIGGGIINSGSLTLKNAAISGNSVINSGTNSGGGIYNNGAVTLINSTVSSNLSNGNGGGICNCQRDTAMTTLINSTVSGNSSLGFGGGIFNGEPASGSTINVTSSTISGNSAGLDGGGIINRGDLNLTNSTVSGNSTSGEGGGIKNVTGSVNMRNTIIASNSAAGSPDFNGTLNSQGYNLIGNTSGTTITGTTTGNILNQNAQLAPLGNNGGATQTHQLLAGSPAIDKGSAVSGITTDQRGFMRPFDDPAIANAAGGNGSDIGAFETLAPTAAAVSVAGRVLVSGGRGLTNAIVTLTDARGNRRTARTTAFGYFHFSEVEAGQTVIVAVASKRYKFAPQVLSISDNLADLTFTAIDGGF